MLKTGMSEQQPACQPKT